MAALRCPRDGELLSFRMVKEVGIEVCPKCRGIFLDKGELERLLPGFHSADLRAVSRKFHVRTEALKCPACRKQMIPMSYGPVKSPLTIDKCVNCGGLWFDEKELSQLIDVTEPVRQTISKPILKTDFRYKPYVEAEEWSSRASLAYFLGLPVEVERRTRPFAPSTIGLILLCVLIYFIAGPQAAHEAGFVPSEILRGRRLFTLVTYIFLHGSFFHLLGNMYFLYVFGDNVEEAFGSVRFLALFILLGIFSALASILFGFRDPTIAHIGASGAISGLMGIYYVLYPRSEFVIVFRFFPLPLRFSARAYLLLWVLLQIVLLLLKTAGQIDVVGHLAGFGAGIATGLSVNFLGSAPRN